MKRRLMAQVVVLGAVLLLGGLVSATGIQPEELALVQVAGQRPADLLRVEAFPAEVYAHLTGDGGPYLLAGATPGTVEILRAQGLDVAVLDGDLRGASYYLAYSRPGLPRLDWDAYGRLLLDDGVQVLLRLGPWDAERLARAGVELRAITFDPKPLRPAPVVHAIPPELEADPLVQSMIDQVSSTTVYSYTGDLSGEWPVIIGGEPYTIETRYTWAWAAAEKATQYAYEHLEALGLHPQYHDWQRSPPSSLHGRNVIGELTGETHPDDIYIICAHIDSISNDPYNDAPGADDNASGSVAVLLAADILSQYRWGCTLRFALWTGEEQGLWGSHYYAQRSYNAGENIVGVLNLDMIAWNTPLSTPDIDLHAKSSMTPTLQLAQLFSDVVGAYGLDLVPEIIANGIEASDHASFWDYGYPAILGIEDYTGGDFNDYYHTVNDLLKHLDMDYYTDFVKASLATFAHMSDCLIYPYQVYLPRVRHEASSPAEALIVR